MLIRRPDKAGYHATMGSIKSSIVFGGRDIAVDKFVPAVNASFHDDEAWLDLNHIDSGLTGRTETEANGKVTHESGDFKHECYTVNDGKLKWDMLFNDAASVPASIRFRVKHSSNLSFYRQVITPEEYAEGARYNVPEVHNSFAVYFNNGKRDNKYQTGKVMHLYSPYFVDEVGAKSPLLDMVLTPDVDNAKMLTLVVNAEVQAWLDAPERVGKMRLDPVLGYDTQGSKGAFLQNLYFYTQGRLASVAGNLTSLNAYLTAGTGAKISIANSNQSSPYYSDGQTVISGGGITTAGIGVVSSIAASGVISAGTWYRIGIGGRAGLDAVNYDTISSYQLESYTFNPVTDPQSPVPTTTKAANTAELSIWAGYSPIAEAGRGFSKGRIVNSGHGSAPQHKGGIVNA